MAITDFFRSISDPYYLRNVVDEFFQVMSEIKDDSKILIEELDEIIHKENALSLNHQATDEEMKTSVDLRKDAEEAFAAKHAELLIARGFTGEWEYTAYDARVCLEKLSDYLQKEEEENDFYLECMTTLHSNFRTLPFKTPARLAALADRLRGLLEEPALPEYQHPEPEQESILGLTDRDKRLTATEEYIDAIKDLCREMDQQINTLKEHGPCFSPFALNEQEQELLRSVLTLVREKTSFGGFSVWASFPHFSSFNRSHDLFSQARQLQEKEKNTLSELSLLSAALYQLISAPLDGKPLEAHNIIDLQQAVYTGVKQE